MQTTHISTLKVRKNLVGQLATSLNRQRSRLEHKHPNFRFDIWKSYDLCSQAFLNHPNRRLLSLHHFCIDDDRFLEIKG